MLKNVSSLKGTFLQIQLGTLLLFAMLPNLGFVSVGLFDVAALVLTTLFIVQTKNIQVGRLIVFNLCAAWFILNLLLVTDDMVAVYLYLRSLAIPLVIYLAYKYRNTKLNSSVILMLVVSSFGLNIFNYLNLIQEFGLGGIGRRDIEIGFFNDINIFLFSCAFSFSLIENRQVRNSLLILLLFLSLGFQSRTATLVAAVLIIDRGNVKLAIAAAVVVFIPLLFALFYKYGLGQIELISNFIGRGFSDTGYSRATIWSIYLSNIDLIGNLKAVKADLMLVGSGDFRPPHNTFLFLAVFFGVIFLFPFLAVFFGFLVYFGLKKSVVVLLLFMFFDLFIAKELLFLLCYWLFRGRLLEHRFRRISRGWVDAGTV
jgi:hypothetical protein